MPSAGILSLCFCTLEKVAFDVKCGYSFPVLLYVGKGAFDVKCRHSFPVLLYVGKKLLLCVGKVFYI